MKFFSLVLLLSTSCSFADESTACLPVEAITINGFFPSQVVSDVSQLPVPKTTSCTDGVDDGGHYRARTLNYENYEVDIVRGAVDRVAILSPTIPWYQGIKTGMSQDAIRPLLKPASVVETEHTDQYITCESDVYAVLDYENKILVRISLVLDRP